jgi:hypothetical protein
MLAYAISRKTRFMLRLSLLLIPFIALPAVAQQPKWYVLSQDDGCIEFQLLVKAEKLSRAPVSPQDFAQMMRERGEQVVIGPPPNLSPELAGKVVQVKVGSWKAPVFVTEEVCYNIDKRR